MAEVGGLSFKNVKRVNPQGVPELPRVIPLIDHRYGRASILNEHAVALSLYKVVNMATGALHVTTREALARRFLIPEDATIILSGVEQDGSIERWWEIANRSEILAGLASLGVEAITAPNYSVLNDVPRTDNLHAIKRILLTWTEMAAAGLPAALHVNARTEHDYRRWGDLIIERSEIEMLAFEFATGAGHGERINWHVEQLCKLSERAGRPLTLIIRGGGRKADLLRHHFAHVTLIDTEAFARAIRRKRAVLTDSGRLKWVSYPTPIGAPIDDLVACNIAAVRLAHTLGQRPAAPRLRVVTTARRTSDSDDQPVQLSFLTDLKQSDEAGSITPNPQRMFAAAKA
ncbi:MAG: hypothetical protein ABL973_18290 [Micropepsaceae bacterium]